MALESPVTQDSRCSARYTSVQVKAILESRKVSAKSKNISTGTNIEFILRNGAKNVTFEKAERDQMKK